jgi:hypothetical protein
MGRKILHQIDNRQSFAVQQKVSAPELGNARAAKCEKRLQPVTTHYWHHRRIDMARPSVLIRLPDNPNAPIRRRIRIVGRRNNLPTIPNLMDSIATSFDLYPNHSVLLSTIYKEQEKKKE